MKRMLKNNKKVIFVCQVTQDLIKAIKCIPGAGLKREVAGMALESIDPASDDKAIAGKLSNALQRLGYANNPIVLSLPRSQITCRNLKIPSFIPQEIERIAALQASHYLPYSSEELITSYQLIQVDKEGYSNIILVIAHRDVINRYIGILKYLKPSGIGILPSSAGLSSLYHYVRPDDPGPVMIADVDSQFVEFAICSRDKLLFSRSFKLGEYSDWETLFISEINKTKDAYLKEGFKEPLHKIIFTGPEKIVSRCREIVNKQSDIPAEILPITERIRFSQEAKGMLLAADNSFASLIGLALKEINTSFNLLPRDLKERGVKSLRIKEYLRLGLLIAGIILVWIISIAKNIDNKERYLKRIKSELAKIFAQAKPVEEIEKKFELLESKSRKKFSSLDLLHELYQVVPSGIFLTSLNYEDNSRVLLRGQANEFNSVLGFVSGLEKSEFFKKFNIKMRYATQKKTQAGEIINFEISCQKK